MAPITPPGGWTYGVGLPIQTLTATLADPWEHTATVDDLVRIARKAEATGHHFVGVCDHVAIPDNDYAAHMGTTWYDTVATLSYLAARTETVNLASAVWIAAYRHPLQTAKSFATLDHLSGGQGHPRRGRGARGGRVRGPGSGLRREGPAARRDPGGGQGSLRRHAT